MYYGGIISILSSQKEETGKMAEKLGKLHEDGKIRIYYRRNGDYIRSVLVPTEYPERILTAAEALSLSSYSFIHVPLEAKWTEGELALLVDSLGVRGALITPLPEANVKKLFKGTSLEVFEVRQEVGEVEVKEEDRGFVYIDRVFVVKGVGVVVTGFSYTPVKVHDKLKVLPQGKEVEVKSIQVLDEDQQEVGVGVRIGFALRNVKEEELKDSFALVKPGAKTLKEFTANIKVYPWSKVEEKKYHMVGNGISAVAELKVDGEKATVRLPFDVPASRRFVVIDVNVRQGKPRVVGYLEVGS
ncbi:MAG: translation elongation factor [Candidatus Aramenus sp.]|nr:translation elongation factor [Candidatus Aramenus sp.]